MLNTKNPFNINIKNNEDNDLLLKIIRRNILNSANEFKNNKLYLVDENITLVELGEIIGKPVNEIAAFF